MTNIIWQPFIKSISRVSILSFDSRIIWLTLVTLYEKPYVYLFGRNGWWWRFIFWIQYLQYTAITDSVSDGWTLPSVCRRLKFTSARLRWLPVEQRIMLKVVCALLHEIMHGCASANLMNILTSLFSLPAHQTAAIGCGSTVRHPTHKVCAQSSGVLSGGSYSLEQSLASTNNNEAAGTCISHLNVYLFNDL